VRTTQYGQVDPFNWVVVTSDGIDDFLDVGDEISLFDARRGIVSYRIVKRIINSKTCKAKMELEQLGQLEFEFLGVMPISYCPAVQEWKDFIEDILQ